MQSVCGGEFYFCEAVNKTCQLLAVCSLRGEELGFKTRTVLTPASEITVESGVG